MPSSNTFCKLAEKSTSKRKEETEMANLIAYLPFMNQRSLTWLGKYPGSSLFLIPQFEAETLLPRLSRNLAALPTVMSLGFVRFAYPEMDVSCFLPDEG